MSVQKSLTSFFKPVQIKRASTDSTGEVLTTKKPKLETCDESTPVLAERESSSVSEKVEPVSPRVEDVDSNKISEAESENKSSQDNAEQDSGKGAKSQEPTYSQRSTQEARDTEVKEKKPGDELSISQCSTQEPRDENRDDVDSIKTPSSKDDGVLKDVTKDDENKSNFTTPVKSNVITTPLGMLSPLQCMARIKSQCSKTPALHHTIGPSWFFALQGEFLKPYFKKVACL